MGLFNSKSRDELEEKDRVIGQLQLEEAELKKQILEIKKEKDKEIEVLKEENVNLKKRASDYNIVSSRLSNQYQKAITTLKEVKSKLVDAESKVVFLNGNLNEKEFHIKELEEKLSQTNDEGVRKRELAVIKKISELREKDVAIRKREAELDELDERLLELSDNLMVKEKELNEYNNKIRIRESRVKLKEEILQKKETNLKNVDRKLMEERRRVEFNKAINGFTSGLSDNLEDKELDIFDDTSSGDLSTGDLSTGELDNTTIEKKVETKVNSRVQKDFAILEEIDRQLRELEGIKEDLGEKFNKKDDKLEEEISLFDDTEELDIYDDTNNLETDSLNNEIEEGVTKEIEEVSEEVVEDVEEASKELQEISEETEEEEISEETEEEEISEETKEEISKETEEEVKEETEKEVIKETEEIEEVSEEKENVVNYYEEYKKYLEDIDQEVNKEVKIEKIKQLISDINQMTKLERDSVSEDLKKYCKNGNRYSLFGLKMKKADLRDILGWLVSNLTRKRIELEM